MRLNRLGGMKLKKNICLFMILTFLFTLCSCSNSLPSQNTIKPSPGKTKVSGNITVWSNGSSLKSLELSEDNFKKNNPKVQFENVNVDSTIIYEKLAEAQLTDSKLPDIISVEDNDIPSLINKYPDKFVNLTDVVNPLKGKFIDMKIRECSLGGKIYAFPWSASPVAVFYRKDIFNTCGIKTEDIKTWDDYLTAGITILGKTSGKTKMIAIDGKNDDFLYRVLLNELGTFYFDEDDNSILNSSKSIRAMKLIKKMNDSKIVYSITKGEEIGKVAEKGTAASFIADAAYGENMISSILNKSNLWGVFKLPAFEPGGNNSAAITGSDIMITKNSNNQNAAISFAKFAMTDNISLINGFKEYGVFPSYIPSYSDPIFSKEVDYFGGQKVWQLFSDISDDIYSINYTNNYDNVHKEVIIAQDKILTKKADVESTMKSLQDTVSSK